MLQQLSQLVFMHRSLGSFSRMKPSFAIFRYELCCRLLYPAQYLQHSVTGPSGGTPLFSLKVGAPELMPLLPALFISGFVFGAIALIYMKMIFGFSAIPTKHKLGYLPFALIAGCYNWYFWCIFPRNSWPWRRCDF